MNNFQNYFIFCVMLVFISCSSDNNNSSEEVKNYTSKVVDGVTIVTNSDPKWGDDSPLKIELVAQIGSTEDEDDNYLLYIPEDITADANGDLYVLDGGNTRVQKFTNDGKYILTIGREGQGPGEFRWPTNINILNSNKIYIYDRSNRRYEIYDTDGKFIRSENKSGKGSTFGPAPSLIFDNNKVLISERRRFFSNTDDQKTTDVRDDLLWTVKDMEDNELFKFGKTQFVVDDNTTPGANASKIAVDNKYNFYLAFSMLNKIEKYDSEGKLVMKISRPLNFKELIEPTIVKRSNGGINIRSGDNNDISKGITVDDKGRIWVLTHNRQSNEDESVGQSITINGEGTMTRTISGETDNWESDMMKIEVFSPNGELLIVFPLGHFADAIKYIDGSIYILDKYRSSSFKKYKIIDNS